MADDQHPDPVAPLWRGKSSVTIGAMNKVPAFISVLENSWARSDVIYDAVHRNLRVGGAIELEPWFRTVPIEHRYVVAHIINEAATQFVGQKLTERMMGALAGHIASEVARYLTAERYYPRSEMFSL